jgi:2,3-bisphosphoglycerate-independent phosphoglycerate mutase
MSKIYSKKSPVVLVIMDGWGEWDMQIGNAVINAKLPTINSLNEKYPKLLLDASGPAVGLPWGVYGNSEVGHQTIGSGQIIFQYLSIIDAAMESGDFRNKEILKKTFDYLRKNNKAFHLWGLCSDGGVHSHINHLYYIIDFAKENGVKDIFIHFITDGRDTNPKIAEKFITETQEKIKNIEGCKIASMNGRFYAMDRNNNWDRIEKAYNVMMGISGIKEKDPLEALKKQYKQDKTDEYLEPVIIVDEKDEPIGPIKNDDAVFCFNYRQDRARQMTRVFVKDNFDEFAIDKNIKIKYLCMAEYEEGLCENVVFPPQKITTRIGEIISKENLKQLRIAETEKYAHVTYFFNGGKADPFPGEDRIFVASKNCKSYAEIPEMSAFEVTDKLLAAIDESEHDFILVNYANSDMVGHTGDYNAGIKACETIDSCLAKLVDKVLKKDGCLIVTADHGNIEEMLKVDTGEIDTEHSTNPVPCWFISNENLKKDSEPLKKFFLAEFIIADIAPTILELLGIEPPKNMRGVSLLDLFRKYKN